MLLLAYEFVWRVFDVEGITHQRRISFPLDSNVKVFEYRWIHANSIIPTNRSMDKFAKRLGAQDVAGDFRKLECGLRSSYDLSEFPPLFRELVLRGLWRIGSVGRAGDRTGRLNTKLQRIVHLGIFMTGADFLRDLPGRDTTTRDFMCKLSRYLRLFSSCR